MNVYVFANSGPAKLRLETAGRNGKSVSVIAELPASAGFLEKLAKQLKSRCGAGGTHRIENGKGVIEIQGDKREIIRKILQQENINFKG